MTTLRGPFIDAMETDQANGDHWAVVALLRSGYPPTKEEWDVYRRAPMGSAAKAASLALREQKAEAWLCYRDLREQGVPVEDAKQRIMQKFKLSEEQVHDYIIEAKDSRVIEFAKRHGPIKTYG